MPVSSIRIDDHSDDGKVLGFDLRDVLKQFEREAEQSIWIISNVECMGETAEAIDEISDGDGIISGVRLLDLAAEIYQTIDGVFKGYWPGDNLPWVVIDAIDSAFFIVSTSSPELLNRLRARFRSVSDIEPYKTEFSERRDYLSLS